MPEVVNRRLDCIEFSLVNSAENEIPLHLGFMPSSLLGGNPIVFYIPRKYGIYGKPHRPPDQFRDVYAGVNHPLRLEILNIPLLMLGLVVVNVSSS